MKTIRLLYPDHVSGGLETYYFGANLLQHILPENGNQPIVRMEIAPPDGKEKAVTNGIYTEDEMKYRLFRGVITLIGTLFLLVGYRKSTESVDEDK